MSLNYNLVSIYKQNQMFLLLLLLTKFVFTGFNCKTYDIKVNRRWYTVKPSVNLVRINRFLIWMSDTEKVSLVYSNFCSWKYIILVPYTKLIKITWATQLTQELWETVTLICFRSYDKQKTESTFHTHETQYFRHKDCNSPQKKHYLPFGAS